MIDAVRFAMIRQKHGRYASWAVWVDAADKPKSNIGDMTVFDVERNPYLLNTLRPDVVMVGLNGSRSMDFDVPFRNFHDRNPRAQDFKIRYAFVGTPFYGAYMTDIIKHIEMVDSNRLLALLKTAPDLVRRNCEAFRNEIRDLNVEKPTILAFGVAAYDIINQHFRADEYSRLVRVTHYSHQISKENYRTEVFAQLDES